MDDWEACILSNRLLFDRASIPHKFNTGDIAMLKYKHKSKINGRLVEVLWFSHFGEYLVKHLGFKNVTSWVKEEYLEPVIQWR